MRALAVVLISAVLPAGAAAQSRKSDALKDGRAIIVVTGMRLQGDPANETKDLSVAEGAVVTVTAKNGESQTRKTAVFPRSRKSGEVYFTADFAVALDTTYNIVMTFQNGTVIRVSDYRLPSDWKTHFSYHSTRGTTSAASILRTEQDERTKLRCYIYALWPLDNYRKMGGRQIE
jgi:hypothetical protein